MRRSTTDLSPMRRGPGSASLTLSERDKEARLLGAYGAKSLVVGGSGGLHSTQLLDLVNGMP